MQESLPLKAFLSYQLFNVHLEIQFISIYVQVCPGTAVCKFGIRDSLGLGMQIESFFSGMDLSAKVKIGVSGCPFCCGESFVRDIGFFGKNKGWIFIIGGCFRSNYKNNLLLQ